MDLITRFLLFFYEYKLFGIKKLSIKNYIKRKIMVSKNVGGQASATLTHALKRVCARCNSTFFQLSDQVDTPGEGEALIFLCHCGYSFTVTLATMGAAHNYAA